MLLHTSALRHKHFFHRDDGAKRNFWTQPRLHTGAFTQRCFLTQVFFHTQYFYTVLLHVSSLTQRFFYPQILLHSDTLALHNDVSLRQAFFSRTHRRVNRDVFKTHTLLHRDSCTQKCCCTEMLSHRDGFRHKNTFPHTHTFTQRWFYTEQLYTQIPLKAEVLLQRNGYTRRASDTQACFCMISDGGHAFSRHKSSASRCKTAISAHLWRSRRISWERVDPAQTHIVIYISCEGVAFCGRPAALRENVEKLLNLL